MTSEIHEITTPELVSETALGVERIDVRLVGSAEAGAQRDLTTYLEAVHGAALERGVTEVVVDLRGLEFMSAGCSRSMVVWIDELQRAPRYVARFVSDAKKPWQRRTLESFVAFAGTLVRLD